MNDATAVCCGEGVGDLQADQQCRLQLEWTTGHELSHVRNLDIRFSLIVAVMVGVIAILADFFLRFTFWGGGGRSRR